MFVDIYHCNTNGIYFVGDQGEYLQLWSGTEVQKILQDKVLYD